MNRDDLLLATSYQPLREKRVVQSTIHLEHTFIYIHTFLTEMRIALSVIICVYLLQTRLN